MEDKDLLQLYQQGNCNYAFNLLVEKYKQPLYHHIRRMVISHDDTDDILQSTFIKVWQNMGNFREESKLYTWIYRIATNETISFLRRKKMQNILSFESVEKNLRNKLVSDPTIAGDEMQIKLQKAILSLPEKQRIIFSMRYYDEMKYEEMAEILHTSTGALKASFHIAVKKIELFLKSD